MRILALEPYYGGSHQAFLDGWISHSRHQWTTLTLPAYHWKWRMRHAAITLAAQLDPVSHDQPDWDLVFCSDMLNLPEFLGLAPASIARLKTCLYFHENQLTYPSQQPREWDYHFSFTNFTSALAADCIWFNSAFHREDLFQALEDFLQRMPDFQPVEQLAGLRNKSSVQSPGIHPIFPGTSAPTPVPRITWASRWEHDKNPEMFFAAIRALKQQGFLFRLNVLGQSFRNAPDVFQQAHDEFHACIDHWGFLESPEDYRNTLQESDIFVSTADHEFFGISTVEAMSAGAYPVLPDRLSYPELLEREVHPARQEFLYAGDLASLTAKLQHLVADFPASTHSSATRAELATAMHRFHWKHRAAEMDNQLDLLARS